MEAILESDLLEFVLDLGAFSTVLIAPYFKKLKLSLLITNFLFLGILLIKYSYFMSKRKWSYKKSVLFSALLVLFNMIVLAYMLFF